MIQPIQTIVIYSNASAIGGTITPIKTNADGSAYEFPVTDSCERNATLRGDDFVKLAFNLEERIVIPAFAFILYDSQIFFCKEEYRPKPKGGYYEYEVKFVSFANMLSKPIAFRHVEVADEQFNEPTIDVNGRLKDIATVICTSIQTAADRYTGILAQLMRMVQTVDAEISISTEMKTFTYEGQHIAKVLEEIVSTYEDDGIDYWFEVSGTPFTSMSVTLHFSKCERIDKDLLEVSDTIEQTGKPLQPIRSRGLLDCDYSQEWTGVPQRIIPFGSDRNIKRNQAIVNNMFVSYGKRLRLHYEHKCTINNVVYSHAYAVKNSKGEYIPLYVDARGSVSVPGITTGEEIVDKYEDIYPRCHYRVDYVSQRGTDNPIYRVYGTPMNADGTEMTQQQIESAGIFPITIEDGATLSMLFESGYLNGREFEVANHSEKMAWIDGKLTPAAGGKWYAVLEIVPEGDNNESAQIPFGNFVPRAKDTTEGGYEGDTFAIFNMVMPDGYVSMAEDELAQKAYDKIQESVATRPEVKCTGEPNFFQSHDIFIGKRVAVLSEKFGDGINADILDHPNLLGAFCIDYTNMAAYSKNDASFVSNTSGNTSDGFAVVQGYKTRQGGGYDWVSNLASRNSVGKLEQSFVYDGSYDRICVKINGSVEDAYILFNPSMEVGKTYTVQLQFDSKSTDGHGNGGTISHIKLEKSAEVSMWTISPSDADGCFVSRVTSFSHSLTKPSSVTFKMSSSRIQGQISTIKAEIADRTSDIQGVEQTAQNISRRGFNDAVELKDMLAKLENAMMVIGVDRYQFSYTMGMSLVNGRMVGQVDHFSRLDVTAGALQHTQEPWIKDSGQGLYTVAAAQITQDYNGIALSSEQQIVFDSEHKYIPRIEPYFVFAHLNRGAGTATIELVANTEEKYRTDSMSNPFLENDDYMLLGTLSSEFDDFNNTSYRVVNKTSGYTQIAGGTITTEQIQDPTRSLIIDLSSNPPRIIAKNGAEIVGNIRFLAADGSKKSVEDVVGEEVGKIEVGGENLCAEKDINITNGNIYRTGIVLERNKKYVITIGGSITSTDPHFLQFSIYGGSYVLWTIPKSEIRSKIVQAVVTGNNGELGFRLSGDGPITTGAILKNIMVQKGNKATDYQEYVKHLADTFLNKARAGSTDIEGGLLMTNVLQLRNEQGVVKAGLSGLSGDQEEPENVLLWGGGNYADAVHASKTNYLKQDGTLLTTLLKKDGTGKIGVFQIGDDKVIVDVPNKGTVIIDVDDGLSLKDIHGIDRVKIIPESIDSSAIVPEEPDIKDRGEYIIGDDQWHDGEASRPTWDSRDVYEEFDVEELTTEHIVSGGLYVSVDLEVDYSSHHAGASVELVLKCKEDSSYDVVLAEEEKYTTGSLQSTLTIGIGLNKQQYVLEKGMTYYLVLNVSVSTSQTRMKRYLIQKGSFNIQYREYYPFEPKTIIGLDGIMCATDYNHFFKSYSGGRDQLVQIKGLPTSEPSGNDSQLWNDNGVLKITN